MDKADMDWQEHRDPGASLADQPMEALRKDHHFVRQLFERYLHTQDIQVKREAGPRILALLEMHMAVEEAVFYPKVHAVDAQLVDHGEQEHEEAKRLMLQLKNMDAGNAQCDALFQQLADTVVRHIETEERQLFPKIEQANLDLTEIGLQMMAFESNMISMLAKESAQRGRRP